jgi:ABC-type lipoprotein release transport system permease subunit
MPLGTFQEMFGMGQGAHAIALLAPDLAQLPLMHREVARLLPAAPELVVLDWDRLIPGLKQIIEADWTIDWFIYVALILVVTLSILNTFIMSVLERTREFGIMLALGATPLRIGTLVFAETALLALIGLGIGIGIGFGIAAYLSVHGFTYPGLKEFMGQYGLPARSIPAGSDPIGPAVILASFWSRPVPGVPIRVATGGGHRSPSAAACRCS